MYPVGHQASFQRIIRWTLTLLGVLLMGSACRSESPPRTPYTGPPRPNVVVYLIDTLRADHLGTYGYPKATSPHIDHWAQTGVVYETAIAPDTCTLGSAPSLLSGQTTVRHGVDTFGKQVDSSLPLLPSVLQDAGYATGSFITNLNAGPAAGLDRGFDHVHDAIKTFKDPTALRSIPLDPIKKWISAVDERPFFLYVHTAEPHRPYTPPEPFKGRFATGYDGPLTGVYRGPRGYENAKTPDEIAHITALYDGEIALADAGFHSLLETLEQTGHRDNTIVILTSDHGEELQDHGHWNHGHTAHRELVHVPLIVSAPHLKSGGRIATPVSLIDIMPSVLQWVDLPIPTSVEGLPLDRAQSDRPLFTRSSFLPRQVAIRHLGWTLIQKENGEVLLYDQLNDPNEQHNLAPQHPERVNTLATQLKQWLAGQTARPTRDLTDEETQRLKLLGYIE